MRNIILLCNYINIICKSKRNNWGSNPD